VPADDTACGHADDAAIRSSLILACAAVLFEHGQTTQSITKAAAELGEAFGVQTTLFPRWGELTLRTQDGSESRHELVAATPDSVDMGKVVAAMHLIDDICSDRVQPAAARSVLETIAHLPPVSTIRFVTMSAAGAGALGVIFGATHLVTIGLIAVSAGAGAWLRRWLATISRNLLVQPFAAAMLAGVIGALVVRLQLTSGSRLVAVCPCMILVPGPHILNGMIDVFRGRLPLGASRLFYAGLVIAVISTGLLVGLALGGSSLPISGESASAPLALDVIAAGVAVAAYATFFAMPWRTLPIPVAIGMLAHATRWALIVLAGASAQAGAFVACFVVGVIITPVADHLKFPFAAFAFACVVSLIPGVFLFRMASGLVALASPGAAPDLLLATVSDGATALLIIMAMAIGLIVPRLCIGHFGTAETNRPAG
jgi:uncharacterized membrane protein YjjP (DUF1212 family)